jgi:hypothetical protein
MSPVLVAGLVAAIVLVGIRGYVRSIARIDVSEEFVRVLRSLDEKVIPKQDIDHVELELHSLLFSADLRIRLRTAGSIRGSIVAVATNRGSLESSVDWLAAQLKAIGVQVIRKSSTRAFRERVAALQRERIAELQSCSSDELLRMPEVDRVVNVEGRQLREMIWREVQEDENRFIVQHYDKRGAYMWADGFVLASDGKRRPLSETERRLYL